MKIKTKCEKCRSTFEIDINQRTPANQEWAEFTEKLNREEALALLDIIEKHGLAAVIEVADKMMWSEIHRQQNPPKNGSGEVER